MAINFPDSPTDGQIFSVSGRSWEYNATKGIWQSSTSLTTTNLSALDSSIVPDANVTYDLGSADKSFRDLYLSGNSIFLGAGEITSSANGSISLPAGSSVGDTEIGTGGGAGVVVYANTDVIPLTNNSVGDLVLVQDTNIMYVWSGSGWYKIATVNESPLINVSNNLNILVGTQDQFTISVTDPEGFPVTYSYNDNDSSSYGTVTKVDDTFTISANSIGSFNINFSASDGVNISAATTTVNIVNPIFATFNPNDAQSGTTTSLNNTRAVCGYRYGTIRGNFALTSGKWYWEIYIEASYSPYVGITDSIFSMPSGTSLGDNVGGANWSGWYVASQTGPSGSIISIAVDVDNQLVWFGQNGTWTGDPSNGTGGTSFTGASVTSYVGDGTSADSAIFRCNHGQDGSFGGVTTSGGFTDNGAGDFKYEVPTGFSSINQITATLL